MIREMLAVDECGLDLSHVEVLVSRSREDWLQLRSVSGLGGSNIAAALGKSDWLGPYGLWLELTTGTRAPTRIRNARNGELLEPGIAAIYAEETDRQVLRFPPHTIIRNPSIPGLFFSPDFLCLDAGDGMGPGVIDAKTWEGAKLDDIPEGYRLQIEVGILVMGWQWGEIAAQRGREQTRFRVERDEARLVALREGAEKFLELVRTRVPPDMDGTEGTTDAIAAVNGEPVPQKKIVLPVEYATLLEQVRALQEEEKAAAAAVEAAKNRFRIAIGDAESFTIAGSPRKGSFKPQVSNVRAHVRRSRPLILPGADA